MSWLPCKSFWSAGGTPLDAILRCNLWPSAKVNTPRAIQIGRQIEVSSRECPFCPRWIRRCTTKCNAQSSQDGSYQNERGLFAQPVETPAGRGKNPQLRVCEM
jgi:hypothetical protein